MEVYIAQIHVFVFVYGEAQIGSLSDTNRLKTFCMVKYPQILYFINDKSEFTYSYVLSLSNWGHSHPFPMYFAD